MSRRGAPKRHVHLTRESIAQAGLRIIDDEGLGALSLRKVAAALDVGTMTLYQYVDGRDDLIAAVVKLLLDEVDLSRPAEDTWEETTRRILADVRAMALRHPNAFIAVAVAPVERPPVSDYARRIMELHQTQGLSAHQFLESWDVIDAYVTGFLLMETARRADGGNGVVASVESHDEFADGMADAHSERVFWEGLEVVLAGLRCRYAEEASGT